MIATMLLYNAVGFVIAAFCFAKFFVRHLAWGWALAALANIPSFSFLSLFLDPRHGGDLYVFVAWGLSVYIGFGGFGIGAIVGMFVASKRAPNEPKHLNTYAANAEPRYEPVRRSLRLKARVASWVSNRKR
ncbi:hypothetical protein [Bradyrhizobium japonicum]|uniref:hypothetical protein n=1 Tax=Bradyrhizobium japonicum TaxID=375 RepID=UPI0004857DD3|nr:hypothetical protein [Bradyrhizobium japonicum]